MKVRTANKIATWIGMAVLAIVLFVVGLSGARGIEVANRNMAGTLIQPPAFNPPTPPRQVPPILAKPEPPAPVLASPTKHIILFIGDGMQLEDEIAASTYLYGKERAMEWNKFELQTSATTWDIDSYNQFAQKKGARKYDPGSFDPLLGYDPSLGGAAPYPLDKSGDKDYFLSALPKWGGGTDTYAIPATDSAAAATALATGFKTDEGNIAWAPGDAENGSLSTILEEMKAKNGDAVGIVTTVQFSHATPSGFAAHNTGRGNVGKISSEIIHKTKPDVVIGGGHPDWSGGYISTADLAGLRKSPEWVLAERKAGQNGGTVLEKASEKAVAEKKRLFGLFGGSKGCFDPPIPTDTPGSPNFNVEEENPSLSEATVAALNVLGQDSDGFFLMVEQGDIDWANHYNDYHWMIGSMWDLNKAVASAVEYVDRPGDDIDWNNTLIIVTADHANGYMRIAEPSKLAQGDLPEMEGTHYHYRYPGGEITYSATGHTNELVTVYAKGNGVVLFGKYEGQRYPGTKIIDNTDIYRIMAEASGVF
jgi:alkaline phosphatase